MADTQGQILREILVDLYWITCMHVQVQKRKTVTRVNPILYMLMVLTARPNNESE